MTLSQQQTSVLNQILDKPFMSDLQCTQPRLIKVMDSVTHSDWSDVKALENANTGKVTVVVAVSNTTSKQQ